MSSVIVKQRTARKVAKAAISWFDARVEREIKALWSAHDKALGQRRALPWWRRLFASRPVPPDREVLFWSAEGSARNTGSLWKWKAQQLLNACAEDDGEAFVDVHTWSVLTDWARAWDGES